MGSRYIPSGKSWVAFATSLTSTTAPTTGDLNAATVLTQPGGTVVAGIKEMDGWKTAAANADVPDTQSNFTGTIPGRVSGGEGKITFYDDDSSVAVRTALAETTAGFILIAKSGRVTGRRLEVWPVTVSSIDDSQVGTDSTASTFDVMFAQTSKPTKNAVCP